MTKKACIMTSASRNELLVVQRRHAKTLVNYGYEVYFIVVDNLEPQTIDGVHYISVPCKGKKSSIKRFLSLCRNIKKTTIAVEADVYQTGSIEYIMTCLYLKRRGKKVYFSMLEGHPYTFYYKSRLPYVIKRIIVGILCYYMKYSLRFFDGVFGVSQDIMDYLREWGIKRSYLLPNYPEVDNAHTVTKEDYMGREPRMIYYGHIPDTSRQEIVFKAMERIPDVHYCLAGKFWSIAYYERLRSTLYWDRVEFFDGFKREELPSILNKCTISNVARDLSNTKSSNGSLGILKLFESMEAALPILCPNLPAYAEIINKYHCGLLIDINDADSIEKAVRYLVDNKDEAFEMGQNGRRAILSEYSWDIVSKLYLAVINSDLNIIKNGS